VLKQIKQIILKTEEAFASLSQSITDFKYTKNEINELSCKDFQIKQQ